MPAPFSTPTLCPQMPMPDSGRNPLSLFTITVTWLCAKSAKSTSFWRSTKSPEGALRSIRPDFSPGITASNGVRTTLILMSSWEASCLVRSGTRPVIFPSEPMVTYGAYSLTPMSRVFFLYAAGTCGRQGVVLRLQGEGRRGHGLLGLALVVRSVVHRTGGEGEREGHEKGAPGGARSVAHDWLRFGRSG